MAPARDDDTNSHGGLGAGGKFRRLTSRRAASSKPYDRPPTAVRTQIAGEGRASGGWLAKIVDPAQRLISASAHRLFASVFRKRLTPPPQQQTQHVSTQSSEQDKEARDQHEDGVSLPKRTQVTMNGGFCEIGNSGRSGVVELEQTLKQKTFTRSEIDRLTALLHSRTADFPSGNEDVGSEMTPLKPVFSCEGKSRPENTPVPVLELGVESHLAPTPSVNQSVLDKDVSPTELAKSYMGSRISKASPLFFGGHSRATRDVTTSRVDIPQKPHVMSLVTRSSAPVAVSTGFITPKSRARSAVYNMARTPYARVNSRSTFKDVGIPVDINVRPSSLTSLSIWEQNKVHALRPGSLKRRSSVLENDIGSVGPIRRIRQKPNLLSSRGLIRQPSSVTSVSAPRSTVGAAASQPPFSPKEKPHLSIKHKSSSGNDEKGTPSTNFASVPTKSSEMASKILQKLDKLVSPTKLSPSMLSGKALKSLEKVDSSKYLENNQDHNKEVTSSMFLPASNDSAYRKLNKIEENGSNKLLVLPQRVTGSSNVLDTSVSAKYTTSSIESADTTKKNSYRGFQMSAPDGSLDWEDDNHSSGVAVPAPAEDREKQKASDSDSKITEAINTGQPLAASDIKTSVASYTGISDGALAAEKNAAFTVPSVLSTAAAVASFSQQNTTSEKVSLTTESNNATLVSSSGDKVSSSAGPNAVCSKPICSVGDKISQPTEFNVSPIFSFGDKVTPEKEVKATSTIISFASKNVDKTPKLAHTPPFWVPGQSDPGVGALPASISGSSSRPETTAAGVTAAKDPESEKSNQVHDTAFSLSASPPTAAAGIFSFGASANGSLATTHSSSSTSSVSLSNFTGQSTSSSPAFASSILGSSSNDNVSGTILPSLTSISTSPGISIYSSAPAIKFDSATVPSTVSSQVATTPGPKSDDKTKHGTNLSNMSSSPFGGSSSITNTGSSIFGLAPVTTSTPNNSSQGSTPFSYGFGATASSPFTAQASSGGSGVITSTQSVQVGSSASSSSFGLGGNFALSNSAALSGSTSGQSSLATSADSKSGSSCGAITDMSSTTLEPGKPSVFGSTFSTNGFAFEASSTAAGASNATPGSLNNSLSSSSLLSFTSSAPSTSAQPTFGNSPAPSFGNLSASQPMLGNSVASSQPTFGNSSASSLPAFGSSSAASSQPAFGGNSAASFPSVFGSTSASSSHPIFGSASTGSQPIFGGTSAASRPIFGGTSDASQRSFGGTKAASQPIFGGTSAASQLTFGNASALSQPAFGSTSVSSQSAFGSTSVSSQPAFGSTSALSQPAFGTTSASSQPAFGTTSALSQPAFGTTSALSQPAFGSTSALSQPAFGSTLTSSQPAFGSFSASSQLAFGSSSASSQPAYGNTSASSLPAFGNTSASSQQAFGNTSAPSQPAFGNHSSAYPFGSASSGHNDQMSMEDSMAEDVQASARAPTTSVFGQQSISPQQSGFVFGSTAPPGPSPFQFGGQQNLSTPQNPSPFQASGSLDFNGGGSFSLGSGGGDKAKRKIIKVKNRGRK